MQGTELTGKRSFMLRWREPVPRAMDVAGMYAQYYRNKDEILVDPLIGDSYISNVVCVSRIYLCSANLPCCRASVTPIFNQTIDDKCDTE